MGMYCQITATSRKDLGKSLSPLKIFAGGGEDDAPRNSVSLEKAWHGLHYLLTGEVWEGSGPLGFLLAGGELLGDDEESGERFFTPEETAAIHKALSGVSDDQLWSRFDAQEMDNQDIYPGIWDEDESDLKDEYLTYFHEMKKVVAAATKAGQGLLISIG